MANNPFLPQKKVENYQKCNFQTEKNRIFVVLIFFSSTKIGFFAIFEIAKNVFLWKSHIVQKQLVFRTNSSYFFKACFLPIEALETTTLKTELSSRTRMAPLSKITPPPSLASPEISISLTKSGKDFTIRDFPLHLRSRNPHLQISHELMEFMVRVLSKEKPCWKTKARRAKLTLMIRVCIELKGGKNCNFSQKILVYPGKKMHFW